MLHEPHEHGTIFDEPLILDKGGSSQMQPNPCAPAFQQGRKRVPQDFTLCLGEQPGLAQPFLDTFVGNGWRTAGKKQVVGEIAFGADFGIAFVMACRTPSSPTLSSVKSRGLLAYHALWIVDCIKQGQTLPMDAYLLDADNPLPGLDLVLPCPKDRPQRLILNSSSYSDTYAWEVNDEKNHSIALDSESLDPDMSIDHDLDLEDLFHTPNRLAHHHHPASSSPLSWDITPSLTFDFDHDEEMEQSRVEMLLDTEESSNSNENGLGWNSMTLETSRTDQAPDSPMELNAELVLAKLSGRYENKDTKPKWAALAQRVAGLVDGPLSTETHLAESIGVVAEIGRSTSKSEVISILTEIGCRDLTENIDLSQCTKLPIAGGGLADIYKGRLDSGAVVAIKCARPHTIATDIDHMQNTAHEIYIWSKCKHENVLDIFGLAEFSSLIAIISPWMENGVLPDYLRENPNSDRSTGLAYLHETGIVHGDIKGSNIIISDNGAAKLADFGNACLTEYNITFSRLPVYTQSLRWSEIMSVESYQAPEICGREAPYSREGDVYALAMTVLEIITGQVPRSNIRNDVRIIVVVAIKREIPPRPVDLIPTRSRHGDVLWSLLERCWATNPLDRPRAEVVKDTLALVDREGLVDEETISSDHAAIFMRLIERGCPNLTKTVDQYRCYKLPIFVDEPFLYRGVLLDGTEISLRPLELYNDLPNLLIKTAVRSAAEELYLWGTCNQDNVLPLLGIAICLQLARGIEYLHDRGLLQRGMDSTCVRVSKDGDIMLLACSNVALDSHQLQLVRSQYNPQRELLETINSTKLYDSKSDVYALGMSLFELTTNRGLIGSTRIQPKPKTEQPPARPSDIPSISECGDQFWLLLSHCWAPNPQDRPHASTVVNTLETIDDEGLYGAEDGVITRPAFIHLGLSKVDLIQSLTGHACPTLEILTVEPAPFARGDITDVYNGKLRNGTEIAVSTWRYSNFKEDFEAYNQLAHQVYTWSKCNHMNVLKLLGVAEFQGQPALICPRIGGGSMPSYLQTAQTHVNRCEMATQIAEGVAYLHSIGVVHGNIQGSKVLVSGDETIKICDFYNAFLRHSSIHFVTRGHSYYSPRWAAPELLDGILESSERADVWALGMTILECITGEAPFSAIEAEHKVIAAILMRELPARPRKCIPPNSVQGDTLWNLLARCWAYEPLERPLAAEVRDIMKTVTLEGLVDPNQTMRNPDGSCDSDLDYE
ncbi:kinase-like protein [Ceratobasidium sp. AG-I]|nr:kinase-like protein [Ceratobasidium sp. AG-I]